MDLQGIREVLRKQPFEPFAIRLADGRSLPGPHPEFVAVGTRRAVILAEDDSWSFIKPLLVVSIDSLPKPHGSGNGKGKGRRKE